MTDERGRADVSKTPEDDRGAPVDFNRLSILETRLGTDARFSHIETQPEFAPDRLVCVYDSQWYPSSVQTARLEIIWSKMVTFRFITTKPMKTERSTIAGTDTHWTTTVGIIFIRDRMRRTDTWK